MYIEGLKLFDFRNYHTLNIKFAKNYNIIYGDNAQGKTNILEAIFLCASGRSHRTSRDAELIKMDECGYLVKLDLFKEENTKTIEISFSKEQKKKIRINDIPVKKIGNLMGNLNAVIFSPEDLIIIKEGPSERRRFIDITISQLKPSYFYDLQQYSKVLFQRNTLLKEIQYKKSLINTLDVWNKNLVDLGSRIIKVRAEFIKRLNERSKINHYKLSNNTEKLEIKYTSAVEIKDYSNLQEIQNAFYKMLEVSANKELKKATTLVGPQRDDYEIFLNDSSLKLYGSQGQQRTAILSLKLSEIDIMKEDTGEYPVILLDDVMSELDAKRQEYLLNNLNMIQTFITCTDKSFFDLEKGNLSKFFRVDSGEIAI